MSFCPLRARSHVPSSPPLNVSFVLLCIINKQKTETGACLKQLIKTATLKQKHTNRIRLLKGSVCASWCGTAVTQITFSRFCCDKKKKKSHLPLFVEAQRIKQSQQWWRGTDLLKYLHSCFLSLPLPPEGASIFLHSRASVFEFVFLRLGKWQPRRQTGALHHAAPEGLRHKTNGSGSVAPPPFHLARVTRRRGTCSVTASPGASRASSNSSLTTKQRRRGGWSRQVY